MPGLDFLATAALEAVPRNPNTPAMTVQELLVFFSAAIALCLIIALLALALVQLFRPAMRGYSQRDVMESWYDLRKRDRLEPDDWKRFPIPAGFRPLFGLGEDDFADEYDGDYDDERIDDREDPNGSRAMYLQFQHFAWEAMRNRDEGIIGRIALPSLWSALPHGLFMKRLQDSAVLVLARPSQHMSEYLALTPAASRLDRATVLYLDYFMHLHPSAATTIMNDKKSLEAGLRDSVATAQQAVSAAADKTLDEMQLRLEASLALQSRYWSIAAGALIAVAGLLCISSDHYEIALPIGLVGGLLSSMIYEASSGILARRRG